MEGRYLGKQRDMGYQEVGKARVTDFQEGSGKQGQRPQMGRKTGMT